MRKHIKKINKWLIDVTDVLKNVLVFAVVCGLLFNDPFGIINTISNLIESDGSKMQNINKARITGLELDYNGLYNEYKYSLSY